MSCMTGHSALTGVDVAHALPLVDLPLVGLLICIRNDTAISDAVLDWATEPPLGMAKMTGSGPKYNYDVRSVKRM